MNALSKHRKQTDDDDKNRVDIMSFPNRNHHSNI